MNKYKQFLGATGEKIALQFLRQNSYKIIAKNFSCKFGEIDIIGREAKTTVFIEVKTRSSCEYGSPQESLKADKIKHLLRCAQFYIKKYAHPDENFRFDVVAIIFGANTKIDLIKDAF